MGFTIDQIKDFHCPRWKELPGLPLYMDQVVLVLEEVLDIFADDQERVLTATMVNNYVKQKLLHPPEKKKYSRDHLALLLMISTLKNVLSMGEIRSVMEILFAGHTIETGYDLFCQGLEDALTSLFCPKENSFIPPLGENVSTDILHAALIALSGKLLTLYCLNQMAQSKERELSS